jgi:prolyl-tRNA synthetase
MRYSTLFTKTRKNAPADEQTVNAKLLIRAGYVEKLMAGVYSYLPLGLRVIKNIEAIVREEMNAIGGQELLLPALHPKANWQQTGGWEGIDVLFKIESRTGKDYALGQSHEEVITPLVKNHVQSYKQLPVAVYQLQNKYRDELRAKSGILRGREFGMKDMYSFHLTQEDFEEFYEIVKQAYLRVYKRCGLQAQVTEASGGSFSDKISYEFMVLTDAGEDEIIYCSGCNWCVNVEIADVREGDQCPKCSEEKLQKATAAEAGNVFDLGQKYTKDFDFYVLDQNGEKVYPQMGCYGIGISRLMGTVVEKYHDQNGIIWPESIAPFDIHLIEIDRLGRAEEIYDQLKEQGIEVLWDDRNESIGAKFADADLLGIPARVVVSAKTADKVEYKERASEQEEIISLDQLIDKIK